jgi:tetratricopeptide (TPR) repeat protein
MSKIFFTTICLLYSTVSFPQTISTKEDKASLTEINQYLTALYDQPLDNIDTARIFSRELAAILIRSGDKKALFNGYTTRALFNLYARKYDSSIVDFKRALALDSSCFICYTKLHWIFFYGKNDFASAAKLRPVSNRIFEKIVSADSNDVNNWLKLYESYGLNEYNKSSIIKNKKDYAARKIVSLDSGSAYNWWQYSFHAPDQKSIRYALEKAYQLDPLQVIYWNALANSYTEMKEVNKLKELIGRCKPADGEDPSYWYQQKAVYLYRLNLKTEALAVYKEAKSKGITIVYKY